jgi:hypothetical protein
MSYDGFSKRQGTAARYDAKRVPAVGRRLDPQTPLMAQWLLSFLEGAAYGC